MNIFITNVFKYVGG